MTAPALYNSSDTPPAAAGFRFSRYLALLFFLLLFLALWPVGSYHAADLDFYAGGLQGSAYPHNLIGYVGAHVASFMLLSFGLSAYPFTVLALLCSLRRLLWRRGVRPASWEYPTAFLLLLLGCAMLLGIWPGAGAALTERLNIATIPGGVLGQRLCAPGSGWLHLLMNSTGSAIVASSLIVIPLGIIWFFDWQLLCGNPLARMTAGLTGKFHKEPTVEEMLQAHPPKAASRPTEVDLPMPPSPVQEPAAAPSRPLPPRHPEPAAAAAAAARPPVPRPAPAPVADGDYVLPSLDLLDQRDESQNSVKAKEIERNKAILQNTLDNFGIEATVVNAVPGPQVTLFEISPAPGVKLSRISSLETNMRMDLQAASLRILTPIPGKNLVGIEVPNLSRVTVTVRNLMQDPQWEMSRMQIPLLLGKNISGKTVILDLSRAPHLLIAGATGSGKSVCMNLLITSMLFRFRPDQLRMIMVDPKVVEFQAYHQLPHLIVPVITEVNKVALALRWAINEMERRYRVLAKVGVRDLTSFNARQRNPAHPEPLDDLGNVIPDTMPFIVLIIDELADIMASAKAEVEQGLAKIAAKSRAVGIHTIIATQRPDVRVITGTIKANYPVRIAFQTSSHIDARTIMDTKGAESLLGQGDMLFKPPGAPSIERLQGGMASDAERDRVVEFVSAQAPQDFDESVFRSADDEDNGATDGTIPGASKLPGVADDDGGEDDSLVRQAQEIVLRDRRPTISYLQRTMGIGYNKAATLIEELERRGVVGPQIGSGKREILMVAPNAFGDKKPKPTHDDDDDEDDATR
ncbi:FtsK/SpoIIIE family DNA translocase [Oligosphaera ethanolica]|uniref:S-DNA-T family DNA segregation ATPase FtsK/SpoIIIE n=1 Tax=Oligosphaera ethanolica TaxID=760260 RepID=A0AAE3VJP0_9BACT|nr:DNA translocase FtsK [Oligosphaera ethanolica]MDQ0291650.1 S-DNA-T family DNA segregation ATPase FtsK/SpoIIIE [Oligosphaera ethanolica]